MGSHCKPCSNSFTLFLWPPHARPSAGPLGGILDVKRIAMQGVAWPLRGRKRGSLPLLSHMLCCWLPNPLSHLGTLLATPESGCHFSILFPELEQVQTGAISILQMPRKGLLMSFCLLLLLNGPKSGFQICNQVQVLSISILPIPWLLGVTLGFRFSVPSLWRKRITLLIVFCNSSPSGCQMGNTHLENSHQQPKNTFVSSEAYAIKNGTMIWMRIREDLANQSHL